jgi:phosphoadenosine phosphosulfate reductase
MPVLDRFGARFPDEPPAPEVILAPDANLDDVAETLAAAAVVGVSIPTLKDGRAFSLARLLRTRFSFAGDLRALGAFIPDQAAFLARCGFTSFAVAENFDDAAFRVALNRFPHGYQRHLGATESIVARRHPSLETLLARYANAAAADLLAAAVAREFPGRIALVSSFGAESAVLLHMLSRIDPSTPVLFLDTEKLFGETLRYRDALIALLGLTDVRTITPDPAAVTARDGDGILWSVDADACCALRKVEPLAGALAPFAAWITGRKSHQSDSRRTLAPIEHVEGMFKFNPLATWSRADVLSYFDAHGLPRHPLEAEGYRSIGCAPCTDRVQAGDDVRAGRWRGRGKTECGIHLSLRRAS